MNEIINAVVILSISMNRISLLLNNIACADHNVSVLGWRYIGCLFSFVPVDNYFLLILLKVYMVQKSECYYFFYEFTFNKNIKKQMSFLCLRKIRIGNYYIVIMYSKVLKLRLLISRLKQKVCRLVNYSHRYTINTSLKSDTVKMILTRESYWRRPTLWDTLHMYL